MHHTEGFVHTGAAQGVRRGTAGDLHADAASPSVSGFTEPVSYNEGGLCMASEEGEN